MRGPGSPRGADVEVIPGQERDTGHEREQPEPVDEVVHEPGDAGAVLAWLASQEPGARLAGPY